MITFLSSYTLSDHKMGLSLLLIIWRKWKACSLSFYRTQSCLYYRFNVWKHVSFSFFGGILLCPILCLRSSGPLQKWCRNWKVEKIRVEGNSEWKIKVNAWGTKVTSTFLLVLQSFDQPTVSIITLYITILCFQNQILFNYIYFYY